MENPLDNRVPCTCPACSGRLVSRHIRRQHIKLCSNGRFGLGGSLTTESTQCNVTRAQTTDNGGEDTSVTSLSDAVNNVFQDQEEEALQESLEEAYGNCLDDHNEIM